MLHYNYAYTATNTPCQPTLRPGTYALGEYLEATYSLPLMGYYNCRPTAGGSPSRHGVWGAVDAHVHIRAVTAPPTPAEKAKGDAMSSWLVAYAEHLGIQRVIWLDRSWDSRARKWVPYTSTFHGNHVHFELCDAASWQLTTTDIKSLEDDDMASPLMDAAAADAFLTALYTKFLASDPDTTGYHFWMKALLAGTSTPAAVEYEFAKVAGVTPL